MNELERLPEEVIKFRLLLKTLDQEKIMTRKPSNEIVPATLLKSKRMGIYDTKKIIIDEIECMRAELNQTAITKGINSVEVMEISKKLDSIIVRFLKDDF